MKIIWTNGTFDVLHPGHLELLEFAQSLGDKLIVGVDTDSLVKEKKGYDRPFFSLCDRMTMLEALRMIDEVRSFNSNEELSNLIKFYKPDIMVVGSDYRGKEVIGSQFAGEVRYYDRNPAYSTTSILERI